MVCREYTIVDQHRVGCFLVGLTNKKTSKRVARVKKMEMAHCISYALGHPRTIGVSARGGFFRELFGGLTNNIIYRSVSTTTSEGCPYNIIR